MSYCLTWSKTLSKERYEVCFRWRKEPPNDTKPVRPNPLFRNASYLKLMLSPTLKWIFTWKASFSGSTDCTFSALPDVSEA